MGGIYYCSEGLPHVWRFPFPLEIQKRLVSADNLTGDITNSDLEHAGQIGQVMIMAANHDIKYATIANGCDNTPAVS